MVDPKLIEIEHKPFLEKHKYDEGRLKSLPRQVFMEKWRMMLKWQDDTTIMTGTSHEIKAHKDTFLHSMKLPEWIPPSKYPKVLDLGCGAGEPEALRQLGYEVTGFTLGPLNIEWAKEKYGIDIIYGDMHDLPFPAESFDAVVTKHSFEHCFAPILVTIEIWHVLRPYGRWVLAQPNTLQDVGFNWSHPTILNGRQRRSLFESFGFRVLENTEDFSVCTKLTEKEIKDTKVSPALGIYNHRRKLDAQSTSVLM